MLYRVTLFTPETHERSWKATDSRIVGNRNAARRAAETLLHPHARRETYHSARFTRAAHVDIHAVPFGAACPFQGTRVETIEAMLTIVPSVGDLGWTP